VIWDKTEINRNIAFCSVILCSLVGAASISEHSAALKMGAADSFETTEIVYYIRQHHILEASNHCHNSLKPHTETTQFDTGPLSLKYEGYSESNLQ
jgi:hypothetical protein